MGKKVNLKLLIKMKIFFLVICGFIFIRISLNFIMCKFGFLKCMILLSLWYWMLINNLYNLFEDNLEKQLLTIPTSIFKLGKYQYLDIIQDSIFKLEYISISWNKYSIDMKETKKTAKEICKFIEDNRIDVIFTGSICFANHDILIKEFNISADKMIDLIINNFDKNHNITIPTNIQLMLIKNTLLNEKCMYFLKTDYTDSFLNIIKEINLDEIFKKFISHKQKKLHVPRLAFFDDVGLVDTYTFKSIHKNKWKNFD